MTLNGRDLVLGENDELPCLEGNGKFRARTMCLNGKELVLGENDELPALEGVAVEGKLEVPATACAFVIL